MVSFEIMSYTWGSSNHSELNPLNRGTLDTLARVSGVSSFCLYPHAQLAHVSFLCTRSVPRITLDISGFISEQCSLFLQWYVSIRQNSMSVVFPHDLGLSPGYQVYFIKMLDEAGWLSRSECYHGIGGRGAQSVTGCSLANTKRGTERVWGV